MSIVPSVLPVSQTQNVSIIGATLLSNFGIVNLSFFTFIARHIVGIIYDKKNHHNYDNKLDNKLNNKLDNKLDH